MNNNFLKKIALLIITMTFILLMPFVVLADNSYDSGVVAMDTFNTGNLQSAVWTAHGNYNDITSLIVTAGNLNAKDLRFIKDSLISLKNLEIRGTATIEANTLPDNAFHDNTTLESVTMTSVTEIGYTAFYRCSALNSINFQEVTKINNNAFGNCKNLVSVNMPKVENIERQAFFYCTSLASINFSKVESIGDLAFQCCNSLTSIDLPELTSVGTYSFSGCEKLISVNLPKITTSGSKMFSYCKALKKVEMPILTSVAEGTFFGCGVLESISFPEVISVGKDAFKDCTTLATYNLPKLDSIGESAFKDCDALTSANFPKVTVIGERAFSSCGGLTSIEFPEITSPGPYAFSSCNNLTSIKLPKMESISEGLFSYCDGLISVNFPKITTIGFRTFYDCDGLKSIDFPKVTIIGGEAFRSCSDLTSAKFPIATSIGRGAFNSCPALISAKFPKATSIGDYAFYECGVLKTLILGETVPTAGYYAFVRCNAKDKVLKVPVPANYKRDKQDKNSGDNFWFGFNIEEMSVNASISPLDGTGGAAVDENITITFDEAVRNIDDTEITDDNVGLLITLKKTNAGGDDVAFDATIDNEKKVITIDPDSDLQNNQAYYVAIGAVVENADNVAVKPTNATFTTVIPGFKKGEGTLSNPYQITNLSQLASIDDGDTLNKYYKLMNDLDFSKDVSDGSAPFDKAGNDDDLSDGNWQTLFGYSGGTTSFKGTLDGNNFCIKGMSPISADNKTGLFSCNEAGTIKNLALVDVNVTANSDGMTGGIVGVNNTSATIENCYVTGIITGKNAVGGLVGSNKGTIKNSYSSASITGQDGVGGLTGANYGTIQNAYATGNVKGKDYIGGLVGQNYKIIQNAYAVGNVTATGNYTGGLVGGNLNAPGITGNIINSYATGNITAVDHIGGMLGKNDGGIVINSYHSEGQKITKDGAVIDTPDDATIAGVNRATCSNLIDVTWHTTGALNWTNGTHWNINTKIGEGFYPHLYKEGTNEEVAGQKNILLPIPNPVVSFNKLYGSVDVAIDADIVLTFNEPIRNIDDSEITDADIPSLVVLKITDASGADVGFTGTINAGKTQITIKPDSQLSYSQKYYVSISGVEDTENYPLVASNAAFTTVSMPVIPPQSSSSGSNDSQSDSSGTNLVKDGQLKSGVKAIVENKIDGDKKTANVIVDKLSLNEFVKRVGEKQEKEAVLSIAAPGENDTITGQLTGDMVKSMEEQDIIINVTGQQASYVLPAKQINIDAVSKDLGKDISLEDIIVDIEVKEPDKNDIEIIKSKADGDSLAVVIPPVEFTVKCSYQNETVEIEKYNNYVERSVLLPNNIDYDKITTAIIYDSDGRIRHIPTKIRIINERYYAIINSMTNSIYTLIFNEEDFADIKGHRSEEDIKEMASRLIIEGETEDNFNPDANITRAQFIKLVIRSLGLKPEETDTGFTDLDKCDDVYEYICTAYSYDLIKGFPQKEFKPKEAISNLEAMVIITRVMRMAGYDMAISDTEVEDILIKYEDKIPDWAKGDIAAAIKYKIGISYDNKLVIKDSVTKAEATSLLIKVLKDLNLI